MPRAPSATRMTRLLSVPASPTFPLYSSLSLLPTPVGPHPRTLKPASPPFHLAAFGSGCVRTATLNTLPCHNSKPAPQWLREVGLFTVKRQQAVQRRNLAAGNYALPKSTLHPTDGQAWEHPCACIRPPSLSSWKTR